MQENRRNINKHVGDFKVMFRVPAKNKARIIIQLTSEYFNKRKAPKFSFNIQLLNTVYAEIKSQNSELFSFTGSCGDYCLFDLERNPQAYEFFHDIERYFLLAKLRVQ